MNLREHRHKTGKGTRVPKIGDIVHIKDENSPRADWRLGKIDKLCIGKDDIVRAVYVKTPLGKNCTTLLRPIPHLYPIESASMNEPLLKDNTEVSTR